MTAPRRPRNAGAGGYLPIVYFVLAIGLVAALLPTALRPPPQAPPSSGQLSPDSPPDDSQVILSELARGSSTTAGVGALTPAAAVEGPVSSLPPLQKPRKGQCFGVPPRQTLSLYSAPCAAAWTGDNGGATSTGVTRDAVHLAMWHQDFAASYEGPVPRQPKDGESARDRTYRVWQQYVNERFETYGREVRFYLGNNTSGNPSTARAEAVSAYENWKPFAGIVEYEPQQPACEEFIRRKVICFNAPLPRNYYLANAPFYWTWYSDTTQLRQMAAEYICKKLARKPARYSGDPVLQSSERKFGLIYKSTFPASATEFERQLRDTCGIGLTDKLGLDPATYGQEEIATGISKFKAAGVTTIIPDSVLGHTLFMTHQSDAQAYLPEWLLIGTEAIDHAYVGRLMSQNQWRHAFGFSGFELPRRNEDTDCFRAYHEIDPDGNPDTDLCRWIFPSLLQIMNGIQLAGPALTPAAFEHALFKLGRRFYPEIWAIGGGFAPGDYGYMDNVVELWWDPTATDPMDSQGTYGSTQGTYRYPNGGRRYRAGEFAAQESRLFEDGVAAAPADS